MTRFLALLLAWLVASTLWAILVPGAFLWIGLAGLTVVFILVTGLGVAFPSLCLFGPFVCRGPAGLPRVALTFDDGPDPASTPALLDFLRDAGVQAAFFCVGEKVEAHPDLAARAVREGHLLGNHSHAHSYGNNFFSVSRLVEDMERAQQSIERAAGTAPRYYRPPVGLSNPRVFRAIRHLGLSAIGWTARGLDKGEVTAERVVSRLMRRAKPGAILLLHDGGVPADRLVETVRQLLDSLKTAGYTVVRLDHLLDER